LQVEMRGVGLWGGSSVEGGGGGGLRGKRIGQGGGGRGALVARGGISRAFGVRTRGPLGTPGIFPPPPPPS
ncbi:hypothetical protein L2200_21125, partial [Xanthomonas perforans]|nr:hypothetical protein [Xanthomonas perforans]